MLWKDILREQLDGGGLDGAGLRILVDFDPAERVKVRRRQIVYLARYGRQPIFSWDDVEVTEMVEWHDELSELVVDEKRSVTAQED